MLQKGKGSLRRIVTPIWARSSQAFARLLGAFSVLQRNVPKSVLLRIGVVLAITSVIALGSTLFGRLPQAQAATSTTITFQGRLLSSTGTTVPDGSYNMQFNLYTVSSGGSTQWTDTRLVSATQGIVLKNGYFSVNLGDTSVGGTAFPSTINWDQEQWLGMTVRGSTSCVFGSCVPTDGEMTPRFKLTAVPYAFSAGQLQTSSGANTLKVQTATPTANVTYTFQDASAGTYNVCTSANNCTSLGSYIQNQNAGDQTADFRVTGTGRANTSFTSPLFDSISGAVTLGGTTATAVTLGNTTNTASFTLQGTVAATYTLGTSTGTGTITVGRSTAAQTINIASANATTGVQAVNIANGTTGANTTVSILSGVGTAGTGTLNLGNNTRVTTIGIGNIAPAAARTITIGGGNSGVVDALNIGTGATTVAGGKTINIGSTAPTGAGTNLITIGSTTNASTLTLQGGTGATAIQLQTATGAGINIGTTNNSQTITIGNTGGATSTNLYAASGITIDGIGATTYNIAGSITTGSVTVGATLQTGLLTLGRSTATNTISIGSAVTSATNTQTVNIANGAGAGTATNVNILSGSGTAGTGTLTLGNNPRVTQIDLGNVSASAARTINIASSNSAGTDTLNIATGNLSSTFNKVVNIANGNPSSSGVNQVTIGSIAAGGNTTTIQGGNGGTALRLMTAASGTLSVGNNGVASTIQVGNTTGAVTQTINIGNNATASSTTNITIGSTIAGTTTLQGLASLTGAVLQGTNTTGLTFEGTTADAFETTFAVVDPTVGDQIYQLPNAAAAGTYQICTTANNCTSLGSYIQNSTAAQNTANFNIQSTGTTNVTAKIRANTSQTADLLQLRDSTDTTTLLAVQADGDLEVDTNTLFVDATNNRVSIGTTSNTFVSAQFGTSNSSLHVSNGAASEANLTLVTNENTQEYFNSQLNFVRSRGTSGTPTVVQNGDDVGALYFYGYDGDTYERLAGILIEADAASGLGDTPGRITLQTTPDGAQLPVDRLVVQNDGDIAVDTNTLFVDATNNRVGIGNAIPTSTLYVEKFGTSDTFITNIQSSSASTSTQTTLNVANAASPGSASTAIYYGGKINIASSSANLTGGGIIGLENQAAFSATGSILYSYGADSYSYNASTGTINNAFGLQSRIYNQTTGSIGTAYASNSFVQNASTGVITTANGYHTKLINAGTVTTSYGLEVENPQNTGTIGTARGVALGDLSAATGTITNRTNLLIGTGTTGNWSIYNNSNYNNYFQGNLRIGTAGTPNAPIDIVAAAATSIRVTAGASWPLILQQDTSSNFTINNNNTTTLTILGATGNVVLGAVDATGSLLVLDTKNTAGDPTGVAGGMYYNSNSNSFRCYTTSWADCQGAGASKFTDAGAYTYLTATADRLIVGSSSDVSTTKLAVISTNNANNVSTLNTQATLTTTTASTRTFNTWLNTDIVPGSAVGTNTNYSVLHLWTGVTSAGRLDTTTDIRKIDLYTEYNSSSAETIGSATNIYTSDVVNSNFTISNFRGVQLNDPGGAGTITANTALNIANQTKGTNNTNLLVGTTTIPTGNWSIYNNSTYDNLFGGSILANNSSAGVARTTEATARTNVTTVTITVAGYANGDVIYINNAGQDYYTRITAGGGTTTLTVSPAVSYDVSAAVTSWNVQNIGASATDYTTQTNRFFQGYFLGGVVTGAGSTTLSDGLLRSTGSLTLQTNGSNTRLTVDTSGRVGIGTTALSAPGGVLTVKALSGESTVATLHTNDYVNASTGSSLAILFGASSGNTYTELAALSTGGTTWNNLILQRGGGNVGIGTVSPGARLEINPGIDLRPGGVPATANMFRIQGGQGASIWGQRWDTDITGIDTNFSRLTFSGGLNSSGSYVMTQILGLSSAGNVSIGTRNSTQMLYVTAANAVTTSVRLAAFNVSGVEQSNLTLNSTTTASETDITFNSGAGATGLSILNGAGNPIFKFRGDGYASTHLGNASAGTNALCSSLANATAPTLNTLYLIRDCNAAPAADFAEMYPAAGDVGLADVVMIGSNQVDTYNWDASSGEVNWNSVKGKIRQVVKATNAPYSSQVFGVVSDNYLDFGSIGHNIKEADNPTSIALVGRVNVKVSTENGPIAAGDFLTASATLPGYAMKATQAGYVIGQALDDYTATQPGEVMVFVKVQYYSGTQAQILNGTFDNLQVMGVATLSSASIVNNLTVGGTLTVTGSASFTSNLAVAGTATLANLVVTGDTVVTKLTVNGKIITGGAVPTVTSGTAAGTGGSVAASIVGNDTAGTFSITTGTSSLIANDILGEVTFTSPYSQAPVVTVSPTTEESASIRYFLIKTPTGWSIKTLDTPQANKTYSFDYHVIQ